MTTNFQTRIPKCIFVKLYLAFTSFKLYEYTLLEVGICWDIFLLVLDEDGDGSQRSRQDDQDDTGHADEATRNSKMKILAFTNSYVWKSEQISLTKCFCLGLPWRHQWPASGLFVSQIQSGWQPMQGTRCFYILAESLPSTAWHFLCEASPSDLSLKHQGLPECLPKPSLCNLSSVFSLFWIRWITGNAV